MGKGDKRTKKGKIVNKSYGKKRNRKNQATESKQKISPSS